VNATEQFKKYALVTTKLVPNTNIASAVSLQDWQLFTESFSIDGGKVAMAQQAATGGETVMDQHGPHGRDGAAKLKKYPEISFHRELGAAALISHEENYSVGHDISDIYNGPSKYIQGNYVITASSNFIDQNSAPGYPYGTRILFMDHPKEEYYYTWIGGWNGSSGSFSTTAPFAHIGTYPGSGGTGTRLASNVPHGEWISLQLPNAIKAKKVEISSRNIASDYAGQYPKDFEFWGSNDGTNWTLIKQFFSQAAPATQGGTHSYDLDSTVLYDRIALVITSINGSFGHVTLSNINYYGYEEDIPLGDTSVDTTFTSIMNTPQTTGAQVYVDGSLGETFTNRVVGPTVSNTHTTYVSAGKYWELSGNVESNVTLEANTFLSGDAPHSLSMWFNSSNLEANVSNSCIFSLNSGEEKLYHPESSPLQLVSNTYQVHQKMLASDGAASDRFGAGEGTAGVSMSGDGSVVVVGANGDDTYKGAAYIFIKDANGHWNEVQKLLASDGVAQDRFGYAASISADGNYIAVGAFKAHSIDGNNTSDTGAVYIFKRNGSNNSWVEQVILTQPDGLASADYFGAKVSLSSDGTYVVAAEMNDDRGSGSFSNAGAAWVFKRTGSSWNTTTGTSGGPIRLFASDDAANYQFGQSLEITEDGKYIAVSSLRNEASATYKGAVYMFARTTASGDNTWSEIQKITASDLQNNDYFGGVNQGLSMSSDGTYLIVGAHNEGSSAASGSVYFYTRTGTGVSASWGSEQKFGCPITPTVSNGAYGSGVLFGRSVGMSANGTVAVVGARDDFTGDMAGGSFIMVRSGSTWSLGYRLRPSDQTGGERFGTISDISSDGSYVIAGAWNDESARGSVYIFSRDAYKQSITTPELKIRSNTWHNLTYSYQGKNGSKVTYLDGRKIKDEIVKDTYGKYPPFFMTGDRQGGYVVSSSGESYATSYRTWKDWEAFNGVARIDQATTEAWLSDGANNVGLDYYNDGSGGYTKSPPATIGTLSSTGEFIVEGEWLKIEMPKRIVVEHIYQTSLSDRPRDFKWYGSNDDQTWTEIIGKTDAPNVAGYVSYLPHTKGAFRYFALVVSKVYSTSLQYVRVDDIQIYGYQENDVINLSNTTDVKQVPNIIFDTSDKYNTSPLYTTEIDIGTAHSQRGYIATSSSGEAGKLFDGRKNTFNSFGANEGATTTYVGNSNHTLSGFARTGVSNEITTEVGGATHVGTWVDLETPRKVKLSQFKVVFGDGSGYSPHSPTNYRLLGRNATTDNWNLLFTIDGSYANGTTAPSTGGTNKALHTVDVSDRAFYKYHRWVCTRLHSTNSAGNSYIGGANINRKMILFGVEYYGAEEIGPESIPIQIGGGNIDKVANFRIYDKFIGDDQAMEIWDAQKDEFGRAKSSMTLQKGRLGIGTTEPEGRLAVLDEPHNLEEFPPKGMVSYHEYFEDHGHFKVTASTDKPGANRHAWRAFDKKTQPEPAGWGSNGGYEWNTGRYTGSSQLYDYGPLGEWIQLEFPYGIKLSYLTIDIYRVGNRGPQDIQIVGSNNGKDWAVLIDNESPSYYDFRGHALMTGHGSPGLGVARIDINSSNVYKYYALIARSKTFGDIGNDSGNNQVLIRQIKLFGIREQSQSVLHDGELTLSKNIIVPRLGASVDPDNTPRRDRLIVEYNTTENPVIGGVVQDTSGRCNHGLFAGSHTQYNSIDKCFDFLMESTSGSGDHIITQLNNPYGAWAHSFSFWFRTWDNTDKILAMIGDDTTNNTSGVYMDSAAQLNHYFFGNDKKYSQHVFDKGRWYHLVVTYQQNTGTPSFLDRRSYIDGIEQLTYTASGTLADLNIISNTALYIGGRYNGASDFVGQISNFKLYDCALSQRDVTTLYDTGRVQNMALSKPLYIATPLHIPGSIVQVKHVSTPIGSSVGGLGTGVGKMVHQTPRQTIVAGDVNSSGNDIDYLFVDFKPRFGNSSILLVGSISATFTHVTTVGFKANGLPLMNNQNNTNSHYGAVTVFEGDSQVDYLRHVTAQLMVPADGIQPRVYTVAVASSWNGASYTVYVNDRNTSDMRSISNLTVYEIAN
jgi:hypothetical protein